MVARVRELGRWGREFAAGVDAASAIRLGLPVNETARVTAPRTPAAGSSDIDRPATSQGRRRPGRPTRASATDLGARRRKPVGRGPA